MVSEARSPGRAASVGDERAGERCRLRERDLGYEFNDIWRDDCIRNYAGCVGDFGCGERECDADCGRHSGCGYRDDYLLRWYDFDRYGNLEFGDGLDRDQLQLNRCAGIDGYLRGLDYLCSEYVSFGERDRHRCDICLVQRFA